MTASHAFEEHVGEVRVRVEAPTLAGVFEEAAAVLCELAAGAGVRATAEPERVVVRAADREALLVDWLNEIVYRSESRARVYPEVRVERASDREIEATLRGAEPPAIRTAVKAATMHDLFVRREGDRWAARFVLDV